MWVMQAVTEFHEVGINLGDPVFKGVYHGKQSHDDDLEHVVQRAIDIGCIKLMVTGSDLKESMHAIELGKRFPGTCYATVGVHPCSTQAFEQDARGPQSLLLELRNLAVAARDSGHAVAFGEIGLDYERLFLSPQGTQLQYFEAQLDLAVELGMPLFLHSRACADDFERLLAPRLARLPRRGLVHSFTGTLEEMKRLVEMGFDIGINGCSMKSGGNMAVVQAVPLERLQIETDGPWCEMRASHASAGYMADAPELGVKAVKKEKWQEGMMVKGRNEPVTIVHVAHVVAKIKGLSIEAICDA